MKLASPWLTAFADIHNKYFSGTPTTLPLIDLRIEIMRDHVDLSLRELAAVLELVDVQYAALSTQKAVNH